MWKVWYGRRMRIPRRPGIDCWQRSHSDLAAGGEPPPSPRAQVAARLDGRRPGVAPWYASAGLLDIPPVRLSASDDDRQVSRPVCSGCRRVALRPRSCGTWLRTDSAAEALSATLTRVGPGS